MLPEKAYEILGYGVIGLGFLLAFFAYVLLTREQKHDEARKNMIKAIYTFMGFSVLLCVIGFGSEMIKIGGTANGEELQQLRNENKELKDILDLYISPKELCSYLGIPSDPELRKEQLRSKVAELNSKAEELKENESHYAYSLFKIEKMIPDYGNSIDTSIRGEKRKETYETIQSILQGIKFYQGPINGDQQLTYEAVKKFQEEMNTKAETNIFDPANFGVFGYRTLETIRSEYRRKAD